MGTEPAGKQAITIGNMNNVTRSCTGRTHGTGDDFCPHTDVIGRITNYRGLSGGTG